MKDFLDKALNDPSSSQRAIAVVAGGAVAAAVALTSFGGAVALGLGKQDVPFKADDLTPKVTYLPDEPAAASPQAAPPKLTIPAR